MPGATIGVAGPNSKSSFEELEGGTDSDGRFRVENLRRGHYRFATSAPGTWSIEVRSHDGRSWRELADIVDGKTTLVVLE